MAGAGLLHLELSSDSSVRGGPQAHPHPQLPACTRAGSQWGPLSDEGWAEGGGEGLVSAFLQLSLGMRALMAPDERVKTTYGK